MNKIIKLIVNIFYIQREREGVLVHTCDIIHAHFLFFFVNFLI
jgi:hypothetical protein